MLKETNSSNETVTLEDIKDMAFINVETLSKILGLGLTYTYDYIKQPSCPFKIIKYGKRYIIHVGSFIQWYNSLTEEAEV